MKRRRKDRWIDLVVLMNFASAWWCALLASGDDKTTVLPMVVAMGTAALAVRFANLNNRKDTRNGDQ